MLVRRGEYAEDETGVLFEIPRFLIWKLEKLTGVEGPRELAYLIVEALKTEGIGPKAFTPDQSLLWMAQKYNLLKEIKK